MAFTTAWRVLGHAGDAEDAVQEAFVDALRLHRRGAVRDWGALLRHLAGCRALDLLRKRRPGLTVTADTAAPPSAQPEAVAVAAERAARLRDGLAQLPAREAEVFSLRHFADLPNPAVAELLGITAGAVAVALHKARTRLRGILEAGEELW